MSAGRQATSTAATSSGSTSTHRPGAALTRLRSESSRNLLRAASTSRSTCSARRTGRASSAASSAPTCTRQPSASKACGTRWLDAAGRASGPARGAGAGAGGGGGRERPAEAPGWGEAGAGPRADLGRRVLRHAGGPAVAGPVPTAAATGGVPVVPAAESDVARRLAGRGAGAAPHRSASRRSRAGPSSPVARCARRPTPRTSGGRGVAGALLAALLAGLLGLPAGACAAGRRASRWPRRRPAATTPVVAATARRSRSRAGGGVGHGRSLVQGGDGRLGDGQVHVKDFLTST